MYTLAILLFLIVGAAMICGILAAFALRRRMMRGTGPFAALMLAVMLWSLAYALDFSSQTLVAKVFWSKVEYVGIVGVPVAWLAFALQYAGRERWLTRRCLLLALVVPALTLALVWSNELHGLIWQQMHLVPMGYVIGSQAVHGAGFWIFFGYANALLAAGTVLLIWAILRAPEFYRGQVGALLLGVLVPWISNLLYTFGLNPLPGVELTPIAFAISGAVLAWAIFRLRLLDIGPIARDVVFEHMGDGVLTLDQQARVVDTNSTARNLLAQDQGAIASWLLDRLAHGSQPPAKGYCEMETLMLLGAAAGQQRTLQVRYSPLFRHVDRPVGWLVTLRDVTELKGAEQMLKRAKEAADVSNHAKSEFLAMITHEIRTPMNGVVGMAGLLRDSALSAQQRGYVQIIQRSSAALLRIINELLDFLKIEAGQIELEHHSFVLRDCVEAALESAASAMLKRTLDLSYQIADAVPATIIADATRLRQMLVNVLYHAVRFAEQGEVLVSIDARECDTPASPHGARTAEEQSYMLDITIRDTGASSANEQIACLFGSLSQDMVAFLRRYGESGLGLAISKRLAEMLGGAMWLEYGQSTGAMYRLRLPVLSGAAGEAAECYPALRGRRALVVDDNPISLQILCQQLQSWQMDAVGVGSGAAALEQLRSGAAFDVALVDQLMPEMDGAALARALRRIVPATRMPLLMLAAPGAVAALGRLSLFSSTIAKPIKLASLASALLHIFDRDLSPAPDGDDAAEGARPRRMLAKELPLDILVVDDNEINQEVLVMTLARLGYQADMVGDGPAAIAACQRRSYDLVLMDIQMPGMDGLETTDHIRSALPAERQPYIVAVTAGAAQAERDECLAVGMDDYMGKPIDIQYLVQVLQRCAAPRGQRAVSTPQPAQALPADHAGLPILDIATLRRLRESFGDRADALPTLIETFTVRAAEMQAAARAAHALGNRDAVMRAAHSLKSNSGTFGALRMSAWCRDLEQRAPSAPPEEIAPMLDHIATEFAYACDALDQFVAGLKAGVIP